MEGSMSLPVCSAFLGSGLYGQDHMLRLFRTTSCHSEICLADLLQIFMPRSRLLIRQTLFSLPLRFPNHRPSYSWWRRWSAFYVYAAGKYIWLTQPNDARSQVSGVITRFVHNFIGRHTPPAAAEASG